MDYDTAVRRRRRQASASGTGPASRQGSAAMSADFGTVGGTADVAANANSAGRTSADSAVLALASLLVAACAALLA